jgi:hypothetical protein
VLIPVFQGVSLVCQDLLPLQTQRNENLSNNSLFFSFTHTSVNVGIENNKPWDKEQRYDLVPFHTVEL